MDVSELTQLLRHDPAIQSATESNGYITVALTREALAQVAIDVAQAGSRCVTSDLLRGTVVQPAPRADLTTSSNWTQARAAVAAELIVGLALAAGAEVLPDAVPAPAGPLAPAAAGASKQVAAAVAFAGEDAVRFWLARGGPEPDLKAMARHVLDNPAYAVRYAHAHAATALRQAADLGLPQLDVGRFQPRLLAHPSERVLLDAMSWLPERVAGAARRRQPHVVAAYLEDLAGRYFDWQEACPVMRPGSVLSRPLGGELTQARLQLASAARTALETGLQLLGITAPGRM